MNVSKHGFHNGAMAQSSFHALPPPPKLVGVKNFRERPAERSQTNLILKRGDIKGGRFSEVPENYWGKKLSKQYSNISK